VWIKGYIGISGISSNLTISTYKYIDIESGDGLSYRLLYSLPQRIKTNVYFVYKNL